MNVLPGLLGMLAVLTMASMCVFTTAVLAAEAAPSFGMNARFIGPYTSVAYLVAAWSGTVTGTLIHRFGAIRVCQLSMLAAAVGLAAFTVGTLPALALSAALLGLAYGPFNPASAHVLANLTSERSRPFVFSVKQLGVPIGGMLAGALVPPLALGAGWPVASLAVAGAALLAGLAVQPLRSRFDLAPGARPSDHGAGWRRSLAIVLQDPVLKRYTLVAFAFAGCQLSAGAFLVVFLSESVGMEVVDAGIALAFMQGGGVAGRLVWGALAARVLSTRAVLASIGCMSAIGLVLITRVDAQWSFEVVAAIATLLGFSAFGWNGVLLSQIATLAPKGKAADATGGMQFVMFGGIVIFPSGVAAAVALSGGYTVPFVALAFLAVAGALLVMSAPGLGRRRWRKPL